MITTIAFDCFGTVFDTSTLTSERILDYVSHVRRGIFTPYDFPDPWWKLRAHPDAEPGLAMLKHKGYKIGTLSNGSAELLKHLSDKNGIAWHFITDLVAHKVYKPHRDAYLSIAVDANGIPEETMMVTANQSFGDLEGAASVGMVPQLIRVPGTPRSIISLAEAIGPVRKVE